MGDLQADHLQPSESIIFRQMEMIEAMNLDPLFRNQMLQADEGKGYFVEVEKDSKKHIFGSKKFFMEYHNCIGNLWLVSTAANTGLGKGNQDPVIWLRGNVRFGETFFSSIGGEDSICKDSILYVTKEGRLLGDAVKTWVHKQYGEGRVTTSYLRYQITKPLLQHLSEVKGDKRARVEGMATLAMMHQLADRRSALEKKTKSLNRRRFGI